MNVYEVNLREEVYACQKENFDPNSYLLIKSRLLAALMSLQRLAPSKWTPQILDSFKAESPTQLKENLLSLLPLSKEESESFDDSSLDSWFNNLCSRLDEHIFIYLLDERAYNIYDKLFALHLKDTLALICIKKYRNTEGVSADTILSEIIGKKIKPSGEIASLFDHPKVRRAIENVLQDKKIDKALDDTVEYHNQKTAEYIRPRLLDAVDTAIAGLVNEARIYVDTQLRETKGLPPNRGWRNKQLTRLGTLRRQEGSNRLEVIKRGKPKGVKKRPKALIKGAFNIKDEFYDKLYDSIRQRSEQSTAKKSVIATKYLKLDNENQLDSILQFYGESRTWKQIRDHALEVKQ